MTTADLLPFTYVVSFLFTVAIFVFLVRQSSQQKRIYWMLSCSLAAIIWLGLLKGIIASVIAISSGFVATYRDSRRLGKRIAKSIGIAPNIFFTSLEQSIGISLYPGLLADLERKGTNTEDARRIVLPFLVNGLVALQTRFGPQSEIDAAFEAIGPLVAELDTSEDATTTVG